jgi:hypothetical protein
VIVEVLPSNKSKMREVLNLLRSVGFKLVDKVCRPAGDKSYYCDLFLHKST